MFSLAIIVDKSKGFPPRFILFIASLLLSLTLAIVSPKLFVKTMPSMDLGYRDLHVKYEWNNGELLINISNGFDKVACLTTISCRNRVVYSFNNTCLAKNECVTIALGNTTCPYIIINYILGSRSLSKTIYIARTGDTAKNLLTNSSAWFPS